MTEERTDRHAGGRYGVARPGRPRGLPPFMRQGWGDRALDLPPHPERRLRRAARRARRGVPGRAAGVPAGTSRCAPTTPTTGSGRDSDSPTSPATRPGRVLVMRERRGRGGALRPAPLVPATPTSSSATASTASCGPAAAPRCTRLAELGLRPRPRRAGRRRSPSCAPGRTRVLRGVDAGVDAAVRRPARASGDARARAGRSPSCGWSRTSGRSRELQEACDITTLGFEDVAPSVRPTRGVSASAGSRARSSAAGPPMGNDIGYDSIVGGGAHATTLHWIEQHRPDHARASCCCSTWASRAATSTPPTSPARCRSTARFTPLQRDLYDLVLRRAAGRHRRRPARACRSTTPTTRRCRCSPHGLEDLGLLPVSAEEALDPKSTVYAAGRCTAPATCSAWTCTTAPTPARRPTPTAPSPRAWCSPSSPASTSRRTTWSPRSCAASASASRTTSWSPPTARNLSAALPRAADEVEAWMAEQREAGPRLPG